MKEMIYGYGASKDEILFKEEDGEYGICILNISGGHPCAYIRFPGIEDIPDYDHVGVLGDVCPHGGFTFYGRHRIIDDNKLWLGWDYGHSGDYCGWASQHDENDKKWTTEEVLEEARGVLDNFRTGNWCVLTDEELYS